jgi:hypothetical protein
LSREEYPTPLEVHNTLTFKAATAPTSSLQLIKRCSEATSPNEAHKKWTEIRVLIDVLKICPDQALAASGLLKH